MVEITLDENIVYTLLASLIVPALGASYFIARHFVNKAKCFTLMKKSIQDLEESEAKGFKAHEDINKEIVEIKTTQSNQTIYLKQILTKLEIPHD